MPGLNRRRPVGSDHPLSAECDDELVCGNTILAQDGCQDPGFDLGSMGTTQPDSPRCITTWPDNPTLESTKSAPTQTRPGKPTPKLRREGPFKCLKPGFRRHGRVKITKNRSRHQRPKSPGKTAISGTIPNLAAGAAALETLQEYKKEAVRLIILREKPINPMASQSNRLVLRQRTNSTRRANCLFINARSPRTGMDGGRTRAPG